MIAADVTSSSLVKQWQQMISTYLEVLCHVITLLGYRPDEVGISLYMQHMHMAMAMPLLEDQEWLRVAMHNIGGCIQHANVAGGQEVEGGIEHC